MKEFISNIDPISLIINGRLCVLATNASLSMSNMVSKKLTLKCYHLCIMSSFILKDLCIMF